MSQTYFGTIWNQDLDDHFAKKGTILSPELLIERKFTDFDSCVKFFMKNKISIIYSIIEYIYTGTGGDICIEIINIYDACKIKRVAILL